MFPRADLSCLQKSQNWTEFERNPKINPLQFFENLWKNQFWNFSSKFIFIDNDTFLEDLKPLKGTSRSQKQIEVVCRKIKIGPNLSEIPRLTPCNFLKICEKINVETFIKIHFYWVKYIFGRVQNFKILFPRADWNCFQKSQNLTKFERNCKVNPLQFFENSWKNQFWNFYRNSFLLSKIHFWDSSKL